MLNFPHDSTKPVYLIRIRDAQHLPLFDREIAVYAYGCHYYQRVRFCQTESWQDTVPEGITEDEYMFYLYALETKGVG